MFQTAKMSKKPINTVFFALFSLFGNSWTQTKSPFVFTPDWIVRYMVENSLGRLWVEHLLANGDSRSEQEIANDFGWKYYLPEAEQEPEVQAQLVQIRADRKTLTPEDILCIDPCQGSGHILVYLFEVLMQIYREDGYSERDAARCILEHNLYGLDIDDRAYQLSYFAVLMKARQYDRMILKKHIQPHVYSIQETNSVNRNQLKYFGADMSVTLRNNAVNQLTSLLDTFKDAKEYGSILKVDWCDWDLLQCFVENDRVEGQMDFEAYGLEHTKEQLIALIEIGKTMAQKYHIAVTNPPYMGSASMSPKLFEYVMTQYANYKSDLFAVFILRVIDLTKNNGFYSIITQQAWMFKSSYRTLRPEVYSNSMVNLLHLGAHAFDELSGEIVQTVAFTQRILRQEEYCGVYVNLENYNSEKGKEEAFLSGLNRYTCNTSRFYSIPNNPTAYWITEGQSNAFKKIKPLGKYITACAGLNTSDNGRFVRFWMEVDYNDIGFDCSSHQELLAHKKKYALFNKGGGYQKWYGNQYYIIAFDENNYNTLSQIGNHLPSKQYYFLPAITWNRISSAETFSARICGNGFAFDDVSPSAFCNEDIRYYAIGLMNTSVFCKLLCVLNRGMKTETGNVQKVPFLIDEEKKEEVSNLSRQAIEIVKREWDYTELSWDYRRHPLICNEKTVKNAYTKYESSVLVDIKKLNDTERQLNQIFIDLYGMNDEINECEGIRTSIKKATLQNTIKTFISYSVGCMFGRYSLDVDGLAYAGGEWKKAYEKKYKSFIPDEDAIIPITDEEYFKDDIVARFVDFIRIVYGEETLEENLRFIADALRNKGDTSRAVIRNYFLNDFYKDHCNTYSVTGSGKRPIYWLFDSGKQNGFKALIYIHRYTPDTVGLIRSVYLHNAQAAIQNSLQNSEYIISTTTSATERARETRKKDKYVKQLNELRPYYQALSHIALQRIPMDLDDGVKKNYQLFQGVEVSTEGKRKQTIDLLAKI